MSNHKNQKVAILIVNGGNDPPEGHWLTLCIGKILEHTPLDKFYIYIWNNNTNDKFVTEYLKFIPNCSLIQAPPNAELTHMHAGPLQSLFERARADGFNYILTLDSDAHPVSDSWLETLTMNLENGAALTGIWRDELSLAIEPYVHASCMCTTIDYISKYNLRLDFIAHNTNKKIHDTLSSLTENAGARNLDIAPLKRSNQRNFHKLIGGIYGNCVYHHGAGSRKNITFWDEEKNLINKKVNDKIASKSTGLLFSNYREYMMWLSGNPVSTQFESQMESLTLIKEIYTRENKQKFKQFHKRIKRYLLGPSEQT